MKFTVTTDLEKVLPASIEFNFEQLKAELAVTLADYRSLVVTEDAISATKEKRAALNKLRNRISDERIRVKKQYLAPYDAFESRVKEIDAMISDPIRLIDSQIKAFEEAKKEAK
ncbi:MAG: DUF1351 domain-containing protein, partial [Oscillospiraceae bacterium]